MDPEAWKTRKCPKCGSAEYLFRHRKKVEPDPGKKSPETWVTKYKCKSCHHVWTEIAPAAKR